MLSVPWAALDRQTHSAHPAFMYLTEARVCLRALLEHTLTPIVSASPVTQTVLATAQELDRATAVAVRPCSLLQVHAPRFVRLSRMRHSQTTFAHCAAVNVSLRASMDLTPDASQLARLRPCLAPLYWRGISQFSHSHFSRSMPQYKPASLRHLHKFLVSAQAPFRSPPSKPNRPCLPLSLSHNRSPFHNH